MKFFLGILLTIGLMLCTPTLGSAATFTDVPPNHWAHSAIETMASNHIVNGTGNGKFTPNGSVSGHEFIAMVCRAFFADQITATNTADWSAPYLSAAQDIGLLNGVTPAATPINRADMAIIIYNLLDCQDLTVTDSTTSTIPDISGLTSTQQAQITAVYQLGYLKGVDSLGNFAPTANMTRAEAATVLSRLFSDCNLPARITELTNQARVQENLSPLELDEQLCQAAQSRAEEIALVFSHNRPDGTSCFSALKERNISYTAAGENIAAGQNTPDLVVDAWLNSSGHRANIMNTKFNHIGVAHTLINGRHYWVQVFTKS